MGFGTNLVFSLHLRSIRCYKIHKCALVKFCFYNAHSLKALKHIQYSVCAHKEMEVHKCTDHLEGCSCPGNKCTLNIEHHLHYMDLKVKCLFGY